MSGYSRMLITPSQYIEKITNYSDKDKQLNAIWANFEPECNVNVITKIGFGSEELKRFDRDLSFHWLSSSVLMLWFFINFINTSSEQLFSLLPALSVPVFEKSNRIFVTSNFYWNFLEHLRDILVLGSKLSFLPSILFRKNMGVWSIWENRNAI